MATVSPQYYDRVYQLTTATGNGNLLLGRTPKGYLSFADAIGTGKDFEYVVEAVDRLGVPSGVFEVGIGQIVKSGDNYYLRRDTVYKNHLGTTAKIAFGTGDKNVWCDVSAKRFNEYQDALNDAVSETVAAKTATTALLGTSSDATSANTVWGKYNATAALLGKSTDATSANTVYGKYNATVALLGTSSDAASANTVWGKYNATSALLGKSTDASTANTVYGQMKKATEQANAAAASASASANSATSAAASATLAEQYKDAVISSVGTPVAGTGIQFGAMQSDNTYTINVKNEYLKLAGGTITGTITSNNKIPLKRSVDTDQLEIYGGTAWNKGGGFVFYGKDSTAANAGGFIVRAHNGTNDRQLVGKPDGTLTWDGSEIVTNSFLNENVNTAESAVSINGQLNTVASGKVWFKVADVTFSAGYVTRAAVLLVNECTSLNVLKTGILELRLRSEANATTINASNTSLRWLSKANSLVNTDFALVYRTSGSNTVFELWCRCPNNYQAYQFVVLSTSNGQVHYPFLNFYSGRSADGSTALPSGTVIYSDDTESDLNKSGGTITGTIKFENGTTNKATVGVDAINHNILMTAHGFTNNGPSIVLWGADSPSTGNRGIFTISAHNGTDRVQLTGNPNGNKVLSWNGYRIITEGQQFSGLTKGTNPSSDTWIWSIKNLDSAGTATTNRISEIRAAVNKQGRTHVEILAYSFESGSSSFASLAICKELDGTAYATAPTPPTGDNSTKIATTAWVTAKVGDYLPLSGGAMTGAISQTSNSGIICRNDDHIGYWAGTASSGNWSERGASLQLYSKNSATANSGSFLLAAYNGTTEKSLTGKPDGALTWGGGEVYVANKNNVSTVGNAITRSGTTNWLRFTGGETDYTDGASVILFGKDHASSAGVFQVRAFDGTNSTNLIINPNSNSSFSRGLTIGGATVSASNITIKNGGLTRGTAPSANQNHYLGYQDKNGDSIGRLLFQYSTSKRHGIYMEPCNDSGAFNGVLGIFIDAAGTTAYTQAPTPAAGDNSTKIATTAFVNTHVNNGASLPTGTVLSYTGTSAPSGWLYCNGAAVSRTTYAALFAVIGTAYGTGNGSTTFNLPDFRNRVPQGGSSATDRGKIEAGLPNITGTVHGGKGTTCEGAFELIDALYNSGEGNKTQGHAFTFDASRSSSIYGNSTTVQPPAVKTMFIIKT